MVDKRTATRIGIVGTGTVGTALATALHKSGYRIACIHDRSEGRAFSLAQAISGSAVHSEVEGIARSAEIVFLTVPDDAIAEVAKAITWRRNALAVHCSGAVSLDALASVRKAGGETAGFHPLQSLAGVQNPISFTGSSVAIEAEGAARELLFSIAYDLGMKPFSLSGADRPVYHTAAVIAGNFCTTLLHVASLLVRGMESHPESPSDALARLMTGAIDNAVRLGTSQGLTGPYARGDVGTVEKHVEVLKEMPQNIRALYVALARITLELGLAKRTMKVDNAARIDALIDILESYDEDNAEKQDSPRHRDGR